MALNLGRTQKFDGELQAMFKNTLGFLTARSPIDGLRQ
jgi:hypothetical protein